jgi:hypothetical protein
MEKKESKQEWTIGEQHYDAVHTLIETVYRLRRGGLRVLREDEREALSYLDYWIGHA